MQNKPIYTSPELRLFSFKGMTAIMNASFGDATIEDFSFYDLDEE